MVIYKLLLHIGKGNITCLKPNRAEQLSALPLRSLSVCRLEAEEGLCSSHKLLPPEGEVRGRREVQNLKPSGEDSGGAA